MDRETYAEHRKIGMHVSNLLEKKLAGSDHTKAELTSYLAKKTGLNNTSINPLVAGYFNGGFVQKISTANRHVRSAHTENLYRIGLTCQYLGVGKQNAIIKGITEINPNFPYPPIKPISKEKEVK